MPKPTPLILPANFLNLCRSVKHDDTFRILMGDDVLYLRFTHTNGKDRLLFKAPETVRIDRVDNAAVVIPEPDDDGPAPGHRRSDRPVPVAPVRVAQGLGQRLAARRGTPQGG